MEQVRDDIKREIIENLEKVSFLDRKINEYAEKRGDIQQQIAESLTGIHIGDTLGVDYKNRGCVRFVVETIKTRISRYGNKTTICVDFSGPMIKKSGELGMKHSTKRVVFKIDNDE